LLFILTLKNSAISANRGEAKLAINRQSNDALPHFNSFYNTLQLPMRLNVDSLEARMSGDYLIIQARLIVMGECAVHIL
jgi:hypothetical protein